MYYTRGRSHRSYTVVTNGLNIGFNFVTIFVI